MSIDQNNLRKKIKLVKAIDDDWTYKKIAEVVDISDHGFYNWLHGYYNIRQSKAKTLYDLVCNLLDPEDLC